MVVKFLLLDGVIDDGIDFTVGRLNVDISC